MHFLQQAIAFPHETGGHFPADSLAVALPPPGLADAPPQGIVAETHLRLRTAAVPRLAEHFRQAVLPVVAVLPAGVAVVLLRRPAVDVIAPADAVQPGGALHCGTGNVSYVGGNIKASSLFISLLTHLKAHTDGQKR